MAIPQQDWQIVDALLDPNMAPTERNRTLRRVTDGNFRSVTRGLVRNLGVEGKSGLVALSLGEITTSSPARAYDASGILRSALASAEQRRIAVKAFGKLAHTRQHAEKVSNNLARALKHPEQREGAIHAFIEVLNEQPPLDAESVIVAHLDRLQKGDTRDPVEQILGGYGKGQKLRELILARRGQRGPRPKSKQAPKRGNRPPVEERKGSDKRRRKRTITKIRASAKTKRKGRH